MALSDDQTQEALQRVDALAALADEMCVQAHELGPLDFEIARTKAAIAQAAAISSLALLGSLVAKDELS